VNNLGRKSSRRRFMRRVLGLGAAAGAASLTLSSTDRSLIHLAQAGSGYGTNVQIDQDNYGVAVTSLESSGLGATALYVTASSYSGPTFGVFGWAKSDQGIGVYGSASAGNGTNYGVQGQSQSASGVGVDGLSNGIGVRGRASNESSIPIVAQAYHGQTASIQEWQSYTGTPLALVDASGRFGIGTTAPQGMLHSVADTGTTYGVWGQSNSSGGTGVYGLSSGVGVQGVAEIASAIPIVALAASGQAASIQEWQNTSGAPLAVVDASGNLGVGTTAPARSIHLRGNTACFRMDRNANSSAFILVRTSNTDFNTIWKTFYVGVDASAADNGSFFIGDVHTNVKGASDKRLIIDNAGNIVPPTTNTGSIGTSSLKWANIYCTNIYHSDLMYENGVRTSEDGDGIAFYNPQGAKIAQLDADGNLYVKGRVVEGLPS
jgi:hypothetical protein